MLKIKAGNGFESPESVWYNNGGEFLKVKKIFSNQSMLERSVICSCEQRVSKLRKELKALRQLNEDLLAYETGPERLEIEEQNARLDNEIKALEIEQIVLNEQLTIIDNRRHFNKKLKPAVVGLEMLTDRVLHGGEQQIVNKLTMGNKTKNPDFLFSKGTYDAFKYDNHWYVITDVSNQQTLIDDLDTHFGVGKIAHEVKTAEEHIDFFRRESDRHVNDNINQLDKIITQQDKLDELIPPRRLDTLITPSLVTENTDKFTNMFYGVDDITQIDENNDTSTKIRTNITTKKDNLVPGTKLDLMSQVVVATESLNTKAKQILGYLEIVKNIQVSDKISDPTPEQVYSATDIHEFKFKAYTDHSVGVGLVPYEAVPTEYSSFATIASQINSLTDGNGMSVPAGYYTQDLNNGNGIYRRGCVVNFEPSNATINFNDSYVTIDNIGSVDTPTSGVINAQMDSDNTLIKNLNMKMSGHTWAIIETSGTDGYGAIQYEHTYENCIFDVSELEYDYLFYTNGSKIKFVNSVFIVDENADFNLQYSNRFATTEGATWVTAQSPEGQSLIAKMKEVDGRTWTETNSHSYVVSEQLDHAPVFDIQSSAEWDTNHIGVDVEEIISLVETPTIELDEFVSLNAEKSTINIVTPTTSEIMTLTYDPELGTKHPYAINQESEENIELIQDVELSSDVHPRIIHSEYSMIEPTSSVELMTEPQFIPHVVDVPVYDIQETCKLEADISEIVSPEETEFMMTSETVELNTSPSYIISNKVSSKIDMQESIGLDSDVHPRIVNIRYDFAHELNFNVEYSVNHPVLATQDINPHNIEFPENTKLEENIVDIIHTVSDDYYDLAETQTIGRGERFPYTVYQEYDTEANVSVPMTPVSVPQINVNENSEEVYVSRQTSDNTVDGLSVNVDSGSNPMYIVRMMDSEVTPITLDVTADSTDNIYMTIQNLDGVSSVSDSFNEPELSSLTYIMAIQKVDSTFDMTEHMNINVPEHRYPLTQESEPVFNMSTVRTSNIDTERSIRTITQKDEIVLDMNETINVRSDRNIYPVTTKSTNVTSFDESINMTITEPVYIVSVLSSEPVTIEEENNVHITPVQEIISNKGSNVIMLDEYVSSPQLDNNEGVVIMSGGYFYMSSDVGADNIVVTDTVDGNNYIITVDENGYLLTSETGYKVTDNNIITDRTTGDKVEITTTNGVVQLTEIGA